MVQATLADGEIELRGGAHARDERTGLEVSKLFSVKLINHMMSSEVLEDTPVGRT